MSKTIPVQLKKKCVDAKLSGIAPKEIYTKYYGPEVSTPMSYEAFKRSLRKWVNKIYPTEQTLSGGTYEGFTAHDATVHVNAEGNIVEAWIKQKPTDFDFEQFAEGIKEFVEPFVPSHVRQDTNRTGMLEIPLYDMHFGIAFLEDYKPLRDHVYHLINQKAWTKICFVIGQDLFHNDSIEHGITSNGTSIEKVDTRRAVKECKEFLYPLIDAAIQNGSEVHVIYSPGNHDRSISWMFVQVLLERYGSTIVDDSFEYRKCITFGSNSIMVTHGDSKRATPRNLASIFAVSFPNEFANAKRREVHCGHLHHEGEGDIFGVMVRRLSSGVTIDDWSNRNDFIGAHREFMIFGWSEDSLSAIYYV